MNEDRPMTLKEAGRKGGNTNYARRALWMRPGAGAGLAIKRIRPCILATAGTARHGSPLAAPQKGQALISDALGMGDAAAGTLQIRAVREAGHAAEFDAGATHHLKGRLDAVSLH